MARYKVILIYDGTDFQGFQRQPQNRTVQGVFEGALREIGWQGSSIHAAGRTDAGVHAAGQVIAFEFEWAHSPEELKSAINANLPSDIAVADLSASEPDFHPRFDAVWRRYQYRLYHKSARDPLRDRYSWRIWPALDHERMQKVADLLIGEHNFAAFGRPHNSGGRTLRVVSSAFWEDHADESIFDIKANGFLYHMVRRLVSFQVDVGLGRRDPESIETLLDNSSATLIQGLAPAKGLILVEVIY